MKVLKSLKTGKSGDHFGLIYEIFKPETINDDLLKSLEILCNSIKQQLKIPKFITVTDITSFYKNKGDRNDLENDRGIFGVGKVRSIIEKLVYSDIYDVVDSNMSDSNVGARKNRSIRDNLFVLYAVRNEAVVKNKPVDLHFMDLSKCFDSLWTEETMNDLYDLGVKDDKFALISGLNDYCRVTIKTPVGQTEEFSLEKIEMQGTVNAPLKCTGQMDSLGRIGYANQIALYKYNQNCFIPILGMIDDALGITDCGADSVEVNAFINTTIESKKLYFNKTKCHKIHIGPKSDECPCLRVHDSVMESSQEEKYLGDMVSSSGNDENMKFKRKLGFQAISDNMTVLKELAAGSHYLAVGLVFRDAVLKSKLLLNSEVWHGLTLKQTENLEDVDKIYLRNILKAHSKVGVECLYLETGKIPLRYDVIQRRLLYLWHILHLQKNELVARIYSSQKLSPKRGDWVNLVENDKNKLGLSCDESEIAQMSKNKFKNIVKNKVELLALSELRLIKNKHSKSLNIQSEKLQIASYLIDHRLTRTEQQLLFRLRTRTLNVKMNFENMHTNLYCSTCKLFPETQSHLLQCPEIVKELKTVVQGNSRINEDDIYANLDKQVKIAKIYREILEIRDKLMSNEDKNSSQTILAGPLHTDAAVTVIDKL